MNLWRVEWAGPPSLDSLLMMGDHATSNGVHGTSEVIAILDAGAQYAKVIDRKVRTHPRGSVVHISALNRMPLHSN